MKGWDGRRCRASSARGKRGMYMHNLTTAECTSHETDAHMKARRRDWRSCISRCIWHTSRYELHRMAKHVFWIMDWELTLTHSRQRAMVNYIWYWNTWLWCIVIVIELTELHDGYTHPSFLRTAIALLPHCSQMAQRFAIGIALKQLHRMVIFLHR